MNPSGHPPKSIEPSAPQRQIEDVSAYDRMLTEMIAAGWGNTPRHLIPEDWRTRPGPDPVSLGKNPNPRRVHSVTRQARLWNKEQYAQRKANEQRSQA